MVYQRFIFYSLVQFIFVYFLDLPSLITSANSLIYEYYYKNGLFNYFFDLIIYAVYISISYFIITFLNIVNFKLLIVILTTFSLSTFFMIFFTSYPKNKSFFSRWFYKTRFKSVFYDCIIISITYLAFIYLYKYIY